MPNSESEPKQGSTMDSMASQWMATSSSSVLIVLAFLALLVYKYLKHVKHPLYEFPGPTTSAWSNALHSYTFMSGRQPYKLLELHEKYGPIVRVAPNELSFSSAQSWKDIYGFRQGHKTFIKSPFYDGGSFADQAHSIVSERDPVEHGKMRKYLSHAFSDRSLKEQEVLVSEIVDLFIEQIGKEGANPDGLDIVMWFNLTTFDIIGSLAFGESFNGVKSGKFHFWIDLVTKALRKGALADFFSRFPTLAWLFKTLFSKAIDALVRDTKVHESHTMALIDRRVNKETSRPDFLTRILEQRDTQSISNVQLAAHASDFVTAGSETTATTLSCVTYYLLKNPVVLQKLETEIRSAFQSYGEINAQSTASLKYLHAVCLEALRIYAPLPFALPRVVPEGGDTIDGHYIPAGIIVHTNPLAASLSSANFKSPWEFRPERWLEDNKTDVLDAAQPFSLGPRGCLGRSLAWIELHTVLAKLNFTYNLELLNKDVDWHRDSSMQTLWKKPVLRVRVHPRSQDLLENTKVSVS